GRLLLRHRQDQGPAVRLPRAARLGAQEGLLPPVVQLTAAPDRPRRTGQPDGHVRTQRSPTCAAHARAKRARTLAALNHANGRSKPHQNGADMMMPAIVTTTPVVRGTRSRAPPTARTMHAPRKATSNPTPPV